MIKKMQVKSYWAQSIVLLSILFVGGCNNKQHFQDLRNYVVQVKRNYSDRPKKIKPITVQQPSTVTYQANNNRSPFEDVTLLSKNMMANPLQAYPLSVLRFVGTITREQAIIALVAVPDDKVYEIKLGDKVGNHGGRVTSILPNQVVIEELTDNSGKVASSRHNVTFQLKDTIE